MAPAALSTKIDALYRTRSNPIGPYIGRAFRRPDADTLRVAVVGINAYANDDRMQDTRPEWFRGWVAEQTYRFFTGLHTRAAAVGAALTERSRYFQHKAYCGLDSLYATNAIKSYLPQSTGKRAAEITDEQYDQDFPIWMLELAMFADAGAFPDVVLVLGEPWWRWACQGFRAASLPPGVEKIDHRHSRAECLHYVNRYRLAVRGKEHHTLLVRCAHPAARTAKGSPNWLLAQPDFREVAGIVG